MTAGEGRMGWGLGFLGVCVCVYVCERESVTSKDAKALLIEAEGSERKCFIILWVAMTLLKLNYMVYLRMNRRAKKELANHTS